jgi:hypothetical protein
MRVLLYGDLDVLNLSFKLREKYHFFKSFINDTLKLYIELGNIKCDVLIIGLSGYNLIHSVQTVHCLKRGSFKANKKMKVIGIYEKSSTEKNENNEISELSSRFLMSISTEGLMAVKATMDVVLEVDNFSSAYEKIVEEIEKIPEEE